MCVSSSGLQPRLAANSLHQPNRVPHQPAQGMSLPIMKRAAQQRAEKLVVGAASSAEEPGGGSPVRPATSEAAAQPAAQPAAAEPLQATASAGEVEGAAAAAAATADIGVEWKHLACY